jgi:SPP1 gp7 family putative phage head morphogenesis protein
MTLFDAQLKNTVLGLRFGESQAKQVLSFLGKLEDDINAEIARRNPLGVKRQTARIRRLENLKTNIKGIIRKAYRQISKQYIQETKDFLKWIGAKELRDFNAAIYLDIFSINLTPEIINTIVNNSLLSGRVISEWWDGSADKLINDVSAGLTQTTMHAAGEAIQLEIAKGSGIARMVQRVSEILQTARNNAEALTRTAVMTTLNEGRRKLYNANSDIIKELVVLATLDSRTSDICRSLSGLKFTLDLEPIGHDKTIDNYPPWHFNCRSSLLPVTKSYKDSGLKEVSLDTRSAMDYNSGKGKQIPWETTYNDWLKNQPRDTQDEVLGKARARYWRKFGLSQQDLTHQNGRGLTVKELGALYGE